jgi:septal ring-binding cell division protein DamX
MPPAKSTKVRIDQTLHRLRAGGSPADAAKIERLEKAKNRSDEQLEADTALEGELDEARESAEDSVLPAANETQQDVVMNGDQQDATSSSTQQNVAANQAQQTAASSDLPPAAATDRTSGRGASSLGEANAVSSREVKIESSEDESPLFVPEASDDEEDPDYGEPLFTRPGPKLGDNVKTVGWISGSRGTRFINQYGKKSAARYRVERSADTAEYEGTLESDDRKKECVSLPKNRYGDRKIEGTNKWEFTKRHIRAIYGVAWEGMGNGAPDEDLRLIEPYEGRPRWPSTYILIAWVTGTYVDANGVKREKVEKAWETRNALRSRWGTKSADKSIYTAACESEARHEEALTGKRRAFSRTPSVGLVDEETRRFREQSLAADRAAATRNVAAATTAQSRSIAPDSNAAIRDVTMSLEQFRMAYCESAGVKSFTQLTPPDKADFMKTWRHMAPPARA